MNANYINDFVFSISVCDPVVLITCKYKAVFIVNCSETSARSLLYLRKTTNNLFVFLRVLNFKSRVKSKRKV